MALRAAIGPLAPDARAAVEAQLLATPWEELAAAALWPDATLALAALWVLRRAVECSAAPTPSSASATAAAVLALPACGHEAGAAVLAALVDRANGSGLEVLVRPSVRHLALLRALQRLRRRGAAGPEHGALVLAHVEPDSEVALRVLRHALLLCDDAVRPPWTRAPWALPECAPTLRVWAALRVWPPPAALVPWVMRAPRLVLALVLRASPAPAAVEPLVPAVAAVLAARDDHDNADADAVALWHALLDLDAPRCAALVRSLPAPSALAALEYGAWQLWDHVSVVSVLQQQPQLWEAYPARAALCLAAWVAQLDASGRAWAYAVALRLVGRPALRLLVALVDDVVGDAARHVSSAAAAAMVAQLWTAYAADTLAALALLERLLAGGLPCPVHASLGALAGLWARHEPLVCTRVLQVAAVAICEDAALSVDAVRWVADVVRQALAHPQGSVYEWPVAAVDLWLALARTRAHVALWPPLALLPVGSVQLLHCYRDAGRLEPSECARVLALCSQHERDIAKELGL